MLKNLLYFLLLFVFVQTANAATGDYRSVASGDWSSPATWQRFNGTAWVGAVAPPTAADGKITISTGDSVTVSNTVDTTFADQVVVSAGAILHVQTPAFVLLNGSGVDMTVNGKLIVNSSCNVNKLSNDPANLSIINYYGDTIVQNGGLSPTINFLGPNTQYISGGGYFNGSMTVNNANNLVLLNSNSFGQTKFINGKIIVHNGVFVVTEYSAPFSGANSQRYIDGAVHFIMYSQSLFSFTLPMGIGNRYLPVTFTNQKTTDFETHYTFTPVSGLAPTATLPSTFDRLDSSRYLNIVADHPERITSFSVQLTYDSLDNVTDTTRVRIIRSEGGIWVNAGGHGTGVPSGKITSSINFTALGDFVLGNLASTTLPLNSSVSSGNVGVSDVYRLTTNNDGRIRLKLTARNNTAVSLSLLDGDSLTNLGILNVNAGDAGSLNVNGLAKGKYYVKVFSPVAGQRYSYILADSLFTPAQANNTEPDSTKALAKVLKLNGDTTGHVGFYYKNHRDTIDWYKLTSTSAGTVKVGLTSASGTVLSLTLYNNTGTTVLGTLKVLANKSDTLSMALPAGLYYITIKCFVSNGFGPYILGDTLITTELKHDVEAVTAEELTMGNKDKTEADILPYPNPATRQLRIQYKPATGYDAMVSAVLNNANGKTVWSNARTNATQLNNLVIDVAKLPAGIYFLQITGDDKKVITKKVIISK